MFIQVVMGKIVDSDTFNEVGPRWDTDVRPAAKGYLGGTVGTTADGRFFVSSRWESADAAAANDDRPEQTKWYSEFAPAVSDVEYHDCPTVLVTGKGNKDDAGFVQVMVGTIKDQAKFDGLNDRIDEMDEAFSDWRSDVLGDVMAVCEDHQHFYDVIYFTSEAEARVGEKQEPTAAVQGFMTEMEAACDITEFIDLTTVMIR